MRQYGHIKLLAQALHNFGVHCFAITYRPNVPCVGAISSYSNGAYPTSFRAVSQQYQMFLQVYSFWCHSLILASNHLVVASWKRVLNPCCIVNIWRAYRQLITVCVQAREVYQADMPTSRQTGGSGVSNEEEDKNMMASDVNFERFKSTGTECFEEADAEPGSRFLAVEPDGKLPSIT